MVDAQKQDDSRSYLADSDELTPDTFPALYNLSAAFFFQFLPIPKDQTTPEYVYVPLKKRDWAVEAIIAEWNLAWESGILRHEMFRAKSKPEYRWLDRFPKHDLRFVPLRGQSRYPGYASLYHLLPKKTLDRFDLPGLGKGEWPILVNWGAWDEILPADADLRLAQAVQYHFWPLLCPGSAPSAFSRNEPIRTLAHNLDFWLPYADLVAQNRMRRLGRVKIEDEKQGGLLARLRKEAPPDFTAERPLFGGYVWCGESEAQEVTREIVEMADRQGTLRAILDAVRTHRVEDDFSPRWSFAKEDFERKIYRKRSKVKVTLVELRDTIPVHGPDVEVEECLLWQAFLGLLNQKEKQIVICLRSGITKASEIATLLGYANHSPISKALHRIRKKAVEFLEH